MPSLIDRILQRSNGGLSPQDVDRLATLAADERSKLAELLRQADSKVEALAGARATVQAFETRLADLGAEQERLQKRLAEAGDLASLLTVLETRSHQIERRTRETGERVDGITDKTEEAQNASRRLERLVEISQEADRRIADFQAQSRELAALDEKVGGIREWLEHFESRTRSVTDDYKELTRTADGLRAELARFQEGASAITHEVHQAQEMASGIEDMISGLTAAKSLARKSEE